MMFRSPLPRISCKIKGPVVSVGRRLTFQDNHDKPDDDYSLNNDLYELIATRVSLVQPPECSRSVWHTEAICTTSGGIGRMSYLSAQLQCPSRRLRGLAALG